MSYDIIDNLMKEKVKWLPELSDKFSDTDVILASRARLARNFEGYPFPAQSDAEQLRFLYNTIEGAITELPASEETSLEPIHLSEIGDDKLKALHERHMIMAGGKPHDENSMVAFINRQRTVSLMLNEEDHLRIQALEPGYELKKAWSQVNRLDVTLNERLDYAYDKQFGYLTACPTNLGTGLRVSVMTHLIGLTLMKQLKPALRAIERLYLTPRGEAGEGTEPIGSIYQISNQSTLGESETTIVSRVDNVVRQLIWSERNARRRLMTEAQPLLYDYLGRAFGTLRNARKLEAAEARNHLYGLRFGVITGILPQEFLPKIDELLISVLPAHLRYFSSSSTDSSEDTEELRASILRTNMQQFEKKLQNKKKQDNS